MKFFSNSWDSSIYIVSCVIEMERCQSFYTILCWSLSGLFVANVKLLSRVREPISSQKTFNEEWSLTPSMSLILSPTPQSLLTGHWELKALQKGQHPSSFQTMFTGKQTCKDSFQWNSTTYIEYKNDLAISTHKIQKWLYHEHKQLYRFRYL